MITMIGYSGFLLGPALIGGLSAWQGLRFALASLILSGLVMSALALLLRTPARAPAAARTGGS